MAGKSRRRLGVTRENTQLATAWGQRAGMSLDVVLSARTRDPPSAKFAKHGSVETEAPVFRNDP